MESVIATLLWIGALGCGLMAGVYFAFSAFIMTALGGVGHPGTVAMNSINTVILRSLFMPIFFATTLASAALVVLGLMEIRGTRGALMVAGGILYVAGMFLVTMFCNVPLNNALLAVASESRTGTAIWQDYLKRWTRWNHVRTVSCLLATAAFIAALPLSR
jgi:uncharacterized membrane protein